MYWTIPIDNGDIIMGRITPEQFLTRMKVELLVPLSGDT
jgi:hypothetical protein